MANIIDISRGRKRAGICSVAEQSSKITKLLKNVKLYARLMFRFVRTLINVCICFKIGGGWGWQKHSFVVIRSTKMIFTLAQKPSNKWLKCRLIGPSFENNIIWGPSPKTKKYKIFPTLFKIVRYCKRLPQADFITPTPYCEQEPQLVALISLRSEISFSDCDKLYH
jgi:hypothetical protein